MLPALLSAASSVLPSLRAGGGGDGGGSDQVSIRIGPVTQTVGGGTMIEGTDSWIWLVALAVLAVVVLRK